MLHIFYHSAWKPKKKQIQVPCCSWFVFALEMRWIKYDIFSTALYTLFSLISQMIVHLNEIQLENM